MKKFYAIAMSLLMSASASVYAQKTVGFSTTNKLDFTRVTENTTSIYMNRTFYAGYNTICLPFSVSADDLKALCGYDVILEKLVKVEENNLLFADVTEEGISAGMPYLIYSPKTQVVKFQTEDMTLQEDPIVLRVDNATMSGKYEPTTGMGIYGIPAQQNKEILEATLVRTVADKTFLPTRCGITFPLSQGAPTIKHIGAMSDETAISKLIAENATVTVYNANGQLVNKSMRINDAKNKLTAGIYVVNGQKFIVK